MRRAVLLLTLAVFLLALVLSCGDANKEAVFDPDTGAHISNWTARHGQTFRAGTGNCTACHGEDLTGGTSGVSCFSPSFDGRSCHGSIVFHPDGWRSADAHGAASKDVPGPDTGFATCQVCHGDDFTGGIMQVTCIRCHRPAPHSSAPWRGGTRTHTNTAPGNAPVCAQCHAGQSQTPAPPGTAPGCFNNTLCHGVTGHADGWETDHAPGARVSTATCSAALCHGGDFQGGGSGIGCFDCHLGGPVPSDPVTGVQIMHPGGWCASSAPQCDENDTPQKKHDEFLDNIGGDATSCAPTRSGVAQYCHGDGLAQGAFINSPPHASWPDGVTCFICHDEKVWTAP
jgi:hypothetical protein